MTATEGKSPAIVCCAAPLMPVYLMALCGTAIPRGPLCFWVHPSSQGSLPFAPGYIAKRSFVRALIKNSKGNENPHAYALGYLTHYVTDVVGHPYVNPVVQAPWRLYWQRHHLVENFIDMPGDGRPDIDTYGDLHRV